MSILRKLKKVHEKLTVPLDKPIANQFVQSIDNLTLKRAVFYLVIFALVSMFLIGFLIGALVF